MIAVHASLGQLRALVEVARRGSFSRAAEALRLTQPAISMQVRQLEDMLGQPLLERVGKRAFATRAGEILIAHAGRAFAELDAAAAELAALRGARAGRVRIGTGATASIYLLPKLLRELRRRHPEIELAVITGNAADMVKAVIENAVDLAVATLPVRGRELSAAPFYCDRLVAIAPPDPAWRRRRRATPSELAAHPLILYERGGAIRDVMDGWFARGGAVPRVAMEVGNAEATKRLVGAGLGLSIISAVAVRDEVRAGALTAIELSPPLDRRIGIVRRRDKPLTAALATVIAALEAFAKRAGA